MTDLKDIDKALALLLIEKTQNRQGNSTYKEVAQELSNRLGYTINPHYGLSAPLRAVSTLCCELGLPLLSARVVRSGSTNLQMVGDGFYSIACELKPQYKNMDSVSAWKTEIKLIRECTDWSKMLDYLSGCDSTKSPAKPSNKMHSNPFSVWMSENTSLSENSISKYSGAVGTISKEMYQKGTISKPFEDMSLFELDIAIACTMNDSDFISKNIRGNHMYSNALKQYRYFISSVTDEIGDDTCLESIVQDEQIPETERKALIQSRIGQGIFRKALLDKCHGRCIITGIDHPKLLVASHIKPWAVSSNRERLSADNGLLLSATYDRLFDSGLITFDRHGKIYLSSLIGVENIKRLGLSKDMCFNLMINSTMGEYLDYHNDVLFVK